MTLADKIRGMSDLELAKYLKAHSGCYFCSRRPCSEECLDDKCLDGVLVFLRQEVEA